MQRQAVKNAILDSDMAWLIAPDTFQGKTYIAFILDKSSSMEGLREAVIDGFNEWLDTQQKLPDADTTYFTLVLFDTVFAIPVRNATIDKVAKLNRSKYTPTGMTALYDAIAHGISAVDSQMTDKDRALIVVLTDGQENSSKEYRTADSIGTLIRAKEATGRYTFTYLSSTLSAWEDAKGIGTQSGNFQSMQATPQGMRSAMRANSAATETYRGGSGQSTTGFYSSTDPDKDEKTAEVATKQ